MQPVEKHLIYQSLTIQRGRFGRHFLHECASSWKKLQFKTLRDCRFYRICGVIRRFAYLSIAKHLLPCIFGKLDNRSIQVLHIGAYITREHGACPPWITLWTSVRVWSRLHDIQRPVRGSCGHFAGSLTRRAALRIFYLTLSGVYYLFYSSYYASKMFYEGIKAIQTSPA